MKYKIDNLQYCNWNRKIFEINNEAKLDAVHVTIAYHEDFDELQNVINQWKKHFEENKDLIFLGKNYKDIEKAKLENKTAIFFGFQNCSPIEDDIKLIEKVHEQGCRFMQLTYNNQSLLATGCYEKNDSGVTNFGREVIREMNRVGLVVDMSHSAEKSTLDAIELSEKPIATTKEQITILNKLSQENDVVLCGNHTRRFFPSINKLKEKLKNHKIKKINIFEGDPFGWNSKSGFYFQGNRGVLLDRGPHIINIINFLTDSKEFNSLSFMHNAHNKDLPESHCKIILKSSEITVQIVVSWIYKLSNEIEVITDKGIFKIGVSSFNFFSYQRGNKKYNITAYPIRTQFDQMSNDVIKSFLDEVNYKKSNSVLSEDIYQSIVLIEKLYDIGKKFNAK